MAEGMSFSFPSLLFHEGRTYGQPEVVRISLPQVATGLRLRLPGSFRRRAFHADQLAQLDRAISWRPAHAAGGTLTQRAYFCKYFTSLASLQEMEHQTCDTAERKYIKYVKGI